MICAQLDPRKSTGSIRWRENSRHDESRNRSPAPALCKLAIHVRKCVVRRCILLTSCTGVMPLDNYPQPTVMVQRFYEGISDYMLRSYPVRNLPLNIRPVSLSSLPGRPKN